MTADQILAIVRQIRQYEDSKIKCGQYEYDGIPSGWFVRIKTDPPQEVYTSTSWGGIPAVTFHPGKWCEYLRDTVLPRVRESRRVEDLARRAKADQDEARHSAPVDDAELFG